MTRPSTFRAITLLIAAAGLLGACGPAAMAQGVAAPVPLTQQPPNPADIQFMSGMIPHHAQAVLIAGWVPTRTTRSDLRILAERIVVGQRDEIELMQYWLKDRNLPVPEATATHHRMVMNGVEHDMLMPGMLSEEELARLAAARDAEFDRLFMTHMIRHHQGALTMVEELYTSHGAAQDETVFRFSSDVFADQTTEIDRMEKMLATVPATRSRP